MRLRDKDRAVIIAAAAEVFGPDAVVRLFGSRTDDTRRGGDIDLHVEADPAPDGEGDDRRMAFWSLLQDRLGEQRIDVVVSIRGAPTRPIERIAYREGVSL